MAKSIAGAGGGRRRRRNPRPSPVVQQTTIVQRGPSPSAPVASDDANSLFSKSSVRIIDLISEGEIEGFVDSADGRKSIFLDGTAIRNSDGTDNFVYDNFEFRAGTQAQTFIPGFPAAESVVGVNAAVGDDIGDSVVRTIANSNVDAVIVTVSIPQLFAVANGLKKTSLQYTIEVQPSGGSYSTEVDAIVEGKCTSAYERSHRIELTGSAPWNIRLKRFGSVHDGITQFRKLSFTSLTEIVDGKLRYPLSALVGLRFEATQFQEVPTRSYDVKGIKVQIPSNATVDSNTGALSYSGIWDGTFQTAWCADPAWIMRDLITSSRYGLGRFVSTAQVDKWSLYQTSKYCAQLVDDGQGGTEPRFACNVYMQSRDEAFSVIQDFASVFRGMAYWSAGQIAFSQDRPSDPAALFTNANVIDGNFNYEGSSLKARHTVALVTWNDPENAYEQMVEYVSDEDAIAKYGIIEIKTAAFGCTSRGQANRAGRWLLHSEQNETSTVTFKVGLDGAIVRPGQIIKVMDSMRAGSRKAGRISAVSGTTVTIDSEITVATNDTITVVLPDGAVEQRTINADSTGTSITISSGFSQTVAPQTIFVIETSTLEAQLFRVISVTEDEELYTIVGLEHNPSKYGAVEDGLVLQPREISTLNRTPDAPGGLDIDEQLVEAGNSVTTEITVSWHNVTGATAYQVSYKTTDTAAYETIGDTTNNSIAFNTDEVGTFTFRVVAISPIGKRSNPSTVSAQIAGKTSLPGNVQNLSFEATNNNSGRLRWDETVDLDVKVGGRVYIRHSNLTDGSATWSNSVDFVKAKAGSATEAIVPLVEGEILAKFADDGGRLSATETSVIITRPDALGRQVVQSRREDGDTPPFQGQKTSTFFSDEFDALTLDGTASFDSIADVNNIDNFDFLGNIASSGVYNFLNVLDLEATYSLDLERHFVTRGFYPANTVDARSENVDDWDDWDGDLADKVNAVLQVRTTTDDPSSSPTWGNWQEFVNGTFKARAYQFRANLTSSDVAQNILVDQLGYEATFQRRTENSSSTIASGAGAKAVTFANAFFAGTASLGGTNSSVPSVGISAQNMQSGDYFTLTNLSGTGFTVSFFNSSNVAVDRNFTYTAVGFGKAG